MSDKRPRVMVDLDPDIEAMLDEEIQRARTDHFLELSRAAAAKALLRRLRATMHPGDQGAPTPPEARPSRGRRASALTVAALGSVLAFAGPAPVEASESADPNMSTFVQDDGCLFCRPKERRYREAA